MNFTLKESLNILKDDIRMISTNIGKPESPNLLIVIGDTALSKTDTVKRILNDEKIDFGYLRGTIKSEGDFYKLLYKNNGRVIVIDDSNPIIKKNSKFNSYLLAITDRGEGNKLISYVNNFDPEIKTESNPNGKYPQHFTFDGSIICISNLPLKKLDDAFKSRAIMNIVTATNDDVIEVIEEKKNNYYTSISSGIKDTAILFLKELATTQKKYIINLRTYQHVLDYFNRFDHDRAKEILLVKINQGIL